MGLLKETNASGNAKKIGNCFWGEEIAVFCTKILQINYHILTG